MSKIPLSVLGLLWVTNSALAVEKINIVTEDWPPFNYALPNGEVGGISSEKVKKVFNLSNLPYDIKIYPWATAYELAKSSENVLIYSIIRSKEREKHFKWICPLTQPVTMFYFGLSGRRDINLTGADDIKRYTIGITPSEFSDHYLQKKTSPNNQNIQMSPDNNTNLGKLLNGKIDLLIETVPSIKMRLERLGRDYSAVRPLMEVGTDDVAPTCMAFGLKTADKVVEQVRRALLRVNAGRD